MNKPPDWDLYKPKWEWQDGLTPEQKEEKLRFILPLPLERYIEYEKFLNKKRKIRCTSDEQQCHDSCDYKGHREDCPLIVFY